MVNHDIFSIYDVYGSMVFDDKVMRERLPKDAYSSLRRTIVYGEELNAKISEVVANTMKDWAIEKGATHYTHWFQPLTGNSAEKHDSFISPTGDGRIIMEFSGKELIKGEGDASSFPSGGLRSTFEARGYTAWDCTSPAFVKDNTLYIPTIFCSYTGEALDKKTPLLRSMELISRETLRILRVFGNTSIKGIVVNAGPEQEYFLIDKKFYDVRKDLQFTGRTLFGAMPPKGQELDDHYYGNIKERIRDFMREVDIELWKLGISAKTEHNEAAPAQHELAMIYTSVNIASDHNQLIMEMLKKIALRHGLICLLHEKPFKGVNGSGKHNNWSLSTDDGQNLFEPGSTPQNNAQFITFLCAVIRAVDKYPDLLRASIATAGNDHRLGACEAPPAIVSVFLGDQLTAVLEAIANGKRAAKKLGGQIEIGVSTLPKLPADSSDRNRTSPFAFTGNKFEFRMLGSADSVSTCNYILNTIVADSLQKFANRLESAEDKNAEVKQIVIDTMRKHKKIIYNGNNYAEEWLAEAEKRGLPNLRTTVDAVGAFTTEKNINLMAKHGILTKAEVESRAIILTENYNKIINIEIMAMIDMAYKYYLPCCIRYLRFLSESIVSMKESGARVSTGSETDLLETLSGITDKIHSSLSLLISKKAELPADPSKAALYYRDILLPIMETLRSAVDSAEPMVAKEYWPVPSYGDLLYSL